jgi:protein O-GlcNAc transferase
MFQEMLGDMAGSIEAAELALELKPDYPPAVLTMGSIEYQRGNDEVGRRLLLLLPTLADDGDLCEVIDSAGDFLIGERRYADGLELYRSASERYPDRVSLLAGLACCAGHEDQFELSIAAARAAVELEPDRHDLMSDLGWSLIQAGRLEEAEATLERAVALDPTDELARENLRLCRIERAQDRCPEREDGSE